MAINPFKSSEAPTFNWEDIDSSPEKEKGKKLEKEKEKKVISVKNNKIRQNLFNSPKQVSIPKQIAIQAKKSYFDAEENEGCSPFFDSPGSSPEEKTSSLALRELSLKPSATGTPEKVKIGKRVLNKMELEGDPLRKDREALTESIKTLETEATDSPQKKQRSKNTREMYQTIINRASAGSPDILEKHDRVVKVLNDVPVLQKAVTDLRRIDSACMHKNTDFPRPEWIINYSHIVGPVEGSSGQRLKGWHLCLKSQEHLLSDHVYSPSGVFAASFCLNAKQAPKRSTFFPGTIETVEQLDALIQSLQGQAVCSKGNRSLLYIAEKNLWMEILSTTGYINTVYPIFFVGAWQDGQSYQVFRDHPLVTSEFVMNAARKAINDHINNPTKVLDPIRFEQDVEGGVNVYIDIATQIPLEMGISQGVYFIFDKNLFNDIDF